MGEIKKIAILLGGQIKNDSRVRKVCETLSSIVEVHLFYIRGSEADKSLFQTKNIFIYNLQYPQTFRQKRLKHSFFYKEFDFFFEQIIQTGHTFDLFYANDLPLLKLGVRLKERFNAKLIYDSHEIYIETLNQFFDFENISALKKPIIKFALRFMKMVGKKAENNLINKADFVLTVNESLMNYFKNKYALNSIDFLYNTPSTKRKEHAVEDIRKDYGWNNEEVIFLYQGMLNKGRGLELMLEAFGKIKSEKARLVIIGGGILLNNLKNLASQLEIGNIVKFYGMVQNEKLINFTKQADWGVVLLEPFNLSKKMASPNKVFEYIHAGIPILANITDETKNVFYKYKVGYLLELSASEIANKIDEICEGVDKKEFIENCRLAKQEYNWENQETKLIRIVRNL